MISSVLRKALSIFRAYKSLLWPSLFIRFQVCCDAFLSFLLDRATFSFFGGGNFNSWAVECAPPWTKHVPISTSLPAMTFGEVEPHCTLCHQAVGDKRSHLKELWTMTCLELLYRVAPRDGLQKVRGNIALWLSVQTLAEDFWVFFSVTYYCLTLSKYLILLCLIFFIYKMGRVVRPISQSFVRIQ